MKGRKIPYKRDFPSDSLNDSLSDYSGGGAKNNNKFDENFEDSLQELDDNLYSGERLVNYQLENLESERGNYFGQQSSERGFSDRDSLQSKRNSIVSGRNSNGSNKINTVIK